MEVCGAQSSVKYTPVRAGRPRVSGAVLDMFSKKRVHARFFLLPKANGGLSFESQTGGRGRFKIRDVPVGIYSLKISATNYWPEEVKELWVPRENAIFVNTTVVERGQFVVCE
jgi:hypothetical protein